jgi:hypothetical protein
VAAEIECTPVLWVAAAFRGSRLKSAVSRDKEFAKTLNVTQFPSILLHNLVRDIASNPSHEF